MFTAERIALFAFGVVFTGLLLALALVIRAPTEQQIFTFRVVLAVALAAVVSFIPGFAFLRFGQVLRASGAAGTFLLIYAVNPPALVTGFTPFAEAMQTADAALNAQQYQTAETFYRRAHAADPNSWLPLRDLGRVAARQGHFDDAYNFWVQAFNMQGRSDATLASYLAIALEGRGDRSGAYAMYDATRKLSNPKTEGATTRSATFDLGRLDLLAILDDAKDPTTSVAYKESRGLFRQFLSEGGQPTYWATYHLGCLDATEAERAASSSQDTDVLRQSALSGIEKAVGDLAKSPWVTADAQKTMLKRRLQDEGGMTRPGDPVNCPPLVRLLSKNPQVRESLLRLLD
jgi:tetratricopeptide (TPR) repeat protein